MDQIEEVKQKTDIVTIIGERVPLKKAGRNYKGLCPFHSEKTPSFMVSPELAIFKCFGCSKSGDVISFLEEFEGMDFYEALKYLAERVGIKLAPLHPGQKDEKELFFHINSLVKNFYHYLLLNHRVGKRALAYLNRERGLKLETIEKFELGFSPKISAPLVSLLTQRKKFMPSDLIRIGLVYPSRGGYTDRFSGRIIFPLFDHRGNTIGFSGRLLPEEDKGEAGKYINSPDTPIYHKSKVLYGLNLTKEEIKKEKSAIIVEGELDLISSFQAGIRNVVAIKGSALTPEQIDLLGRFSPEIILALDTDLAGDTAARRGIAVAFTKGMEIKVASLSDYKDPDEAARKNPEGLKNAIRGAIGVWDFLVDSVFAKYSRKTGEGKAKISREIVPILTSIPDKILQAHYVSRVAEKLSVPETAVLTEIEKSQPEFSYLTEKEVVLPEEEKTRRQLLEEQYISLAFSKDPAILLGTTKKELFTFNLHKRILEELESFFKKQKKFNLNQFSKNLPKELFDGFSGIVIKDLGLLTEDEDKFEKELLLIEKEITILDLKDQLTKIASDLKKAEVSKEKEIASKLEKAFTNLGRKLSELEENS